MQGHDIKLNTFKTSLALRLRSHDAGTGRKRHEKVTFSLSVHTTYVGTKLYDTVTFTVTKQCLFINGMRWKRNALRYRM